MSTKNLTFETKTANESDIFLHLNLSNDRFIPKLSQRVNIKEYSRKIYEFAHTFEAWDQDSLIGLIAAYFNKETNLVYITSVSVLQKYSKIGIATTLIKMCTNYASVNSFKEIKLEVSNENITAINFYKKFNFEIIEEKNNALIMNHKIK